MQTALIRETAERLDAHRKRQLALHPALTMTDMCNVLDGSRGRSPSSARVEPMDLEGERPREPQVPGSLEGERPREPQEPLTPKQRAIHDQGLITVLRQLHDELDAAVAAAYGWGEDWREDGGRKAEDGELLERLVALNRQRADEESRGLIRYLRPAYHQPHVVPASAGNATVQSDLRPPSLSSRRPAYQTRISVPVE